MELVLGHLSTLECPRVNLGSCRHILELEDLVTVEVENRSKAKPLQLAERKLAAHGAAGH